MRFKIDWASLIVGSKFTVFALFYFVFEGNFPRTNPWRAYIWRGDLTQGFLRYQFGVLFLEGLIYGGAYFRIFTVFALYNDNKKDQCHFNFIHNAAISTFNDNFTTKPLLSHVVQKG